MSLDFEHIDDWANVQRHDFENMIVLCATCHRRKGNGPGQIDRKSLRIYKANLAVINSRYSDLERRLLEYFAEKRQELFAHYADEPEAVPHWLLRLSVPLHGSLRLMTAYLTKDGFVEIVPGGSTMHSIVAPDNWFTMDELPPGMLPEIDYYRLTPEGVEFLDAWLGAQPIDELAD